MKTLKKTLALVLALVLALGVFGAIPAGAFTDDEDITYGEAVDLLAALGILNGFEDGSFDPDGELTRAQGAKIIAYLFLSPEVASVLPATNTIFKDVPSYHWASPYIAWAVENDVINGYGDGTFGPEDPLTGLQFAKMILARLGYGAKNEFIGDSWASQTAVIAQRIGLMKTVLDAMNNTKPLQREQAAQVAANTIFEKIFFVRFVEFLNDYVTGNVLGTGAESSLADKDHYDYAAVEGEVKFDTKTNTLIFSSQKDAEGKGYNLSIDLPAATPADFGRHVKVNVVNASTQKTAAALGAITYTDAVLYESGKGVDFGAVTDSTSTNTAYKAKAVTTGLKVLVNGEEKSASVSSSEPIGKITAITGLTNNKVGAGALVRLINTKGDAKGDIDQIIIIEKTFNILSDDVKTVKSGNNTLVKINGDANNANVNNVFGYEDLKKGTAILTTKMFSGNSYYWIETAPSVTGVLKGFKGEPDVPTAVTIDTTSYNKSGISPAPDGKALSVFTADDSGSFGLKFVVYLDNFSNAITMVTEDEAAAANYFVYIGKTTDNTDIFNPKTVARLLGMDGQYVDITPDEDSADALGDTIKAYSFVTYIESTTSGQYTISAVANDKALNAKTPVVGSYNVGKPNIIKVDTDMQITGNSATKFFFYNTATKKLNVYEGVANTPKMNDGSASIVSAIQKAGGIASYAFIAHNATLTAAGETSTLVYILDAKGGTIVDGGTRYTVVKAIDTNGDELELNVVTGANGMEKITGGTWLFKATTNAKGFTTLADHDAITGEGYNAPSGGTFIIKGVPEGETTVTAYHTYNDSTVFIKVTRADDDIATYTLGANSITEDDPDGNVLFKTVSGVLDYVIIEVDAD